MLMNSPGFTHLYPFLSGVGGSFDIKKGNYYFYVISLSIALILANVIFFFNEALETGVLLAVFFLLLITTLSIAGSIILVSWWVSRRPVLYYPKLYSKEEMPLLRSISIIIQAIFAGLMASFIGLVVTLPLILLSIRFYFYLPTLFIFELLYFVLLVLSIIAQFFIYEKGLVVRLQTISNKDDFTLKAPSIDSYTEAGVHNPFRKDYHFEWDKKEIARICTECSVVYGLGEEKCPVCETKNNLYPEIYNLSTKLYTEINEEEAEKIIEKLNEYSEILFDL